jgi:uncharacterized protein YecE (DUF72 family)
MSKLLVGTSGYSYTHWSGGVFYPKGLTQNKWLEHYCKFFNTTELNVSFYRLPSVSAYKSWYRRTPKDFSFALKGSRYITHIRRLKDCEEPLKLFFDNAAQLSEKLVCVLWQIPPGLKKDIKLLEAFLRLLARVKVKTRHSLEFRHDSWFHKEVYGLLRDHGINLCIAHSDRWPQVREVTADFLYLRFHGTGPLYSSNYSLKQLRDWARFARQYLQRNLDVLAYFNNDNKGYAIKNALRFRELIE